MLEQERRIDTTDGRMDVFVTYPNDGRAHPVAGELYFACAEDDDYVPGKVIDKLEAHLDGTALNYRIDWYPGTRHGFAFADRVDAYDGVSAERLWERLFALFERNLRPHRVC